jgi:hypothetical protein
LCGYLILYLKPHELYRLAHTIYFSTEGQGKLPTSAHLNHFLEIIETSALIQKDETGFYRN